MGEIEQLIQQINLLKWDLTASDYKVIKYMEYKAIGQLAPYDIEEVYRERQEKRDLINELQEKLNRLVEQEVEANVIEGN